MAHFLEDDLNVHGLARHDVESGEFGLCGRRHNVFDNVGDVEDGAVVVGDVGAVGEKEMSSSATAGLGFAEVAGITVYSEFHVTGVVCDDGVVLGAEIVQQLLSLFQRVLGRPC